MLESLLVFNILEVTLHIFDAHVLGLEALLFVDVFHYILLKSLALLIHNGHASIDIGRHLLFNLALGSYAASHGPAYCRHHSQSILVLVGLVFNVVAEIVSGHAVNLFGSQLPLLLLPLAISLLLACTHILMRNLLSISI